MAEKWRLRFYTMWIGQAFSLFGSSLVGFALIWWLTEETGSETVLALSTLAALVPTMALGPFAGTFIDRYSRKTIMILADGGIALVTLALLIAFALGVQQVWMIFAALFLRSLGDAFHSPAMMASTTLLVPEDRLTRVGGMNRVLRGAMQIVAPVVGALLIETFEMRAVLMVDVTTAAIAIGALAAIRVPRPERAPAGETVWRGLVEGVRYLRGAKSVCFVVLTCTMANLFCGPASAFRPLLIKDAFGGGAAELGYASSAAGIGLILGGLILGVWGGFRRKLITSGFGWGGVGAAMIALSLLPGNMYWLALVMLMLSGVFSAIGGAPLDAYYQSHVPHEMQGRVFALLATLDNATVPIGLIAAAVAGARVPVRAWFLLLGVSHLLLGVLWPFSRRLREAEEDVT